MIEIKEQHGYKFIRKDGLTQSVMPPYPNGYWQQLIPDGIKPENVLLLGLGVGTVCFQLKDKFPDVEIEAVDKSKKMIELALREFRVQSIVKDIHCKDAFKFVNDCKKKYSLVIVDLFDGFKFDMTVITDIFLDKCKKLLKEGGTLVVNVPNLFQCEHNFTEAKSSDTNKIYFYSKETIVH